MATVRTTTYLLVLILVISLASSCEQEFIPEQSEEDVQLVVEAYIEAGEDPSPPYAVLTRSSAFFSEININDLNDVFVHDAKITIEGPDGSAELTELCLNELEEDQKELAASLLGINIDSIAINFCVYLDLSFNLIGEAGEEYTLKVEAEGQIYRQRQPYLYTLLWRI